MNDCRCNSSKINICATTSKETINIQNNNSANIITKIIDSWRDAPGCLIQVLQEVQAAQGYLSDNAIAQIATELDLSKANVFGVATFYTQFHLQKRGQHIIKVCIGTACHVKGAQQILDFLKDELQLTAGGTSENKLFSLETVACVGACVLAPVVVIDDRTIGRVTVKSLKKELSKYKVKEQQPQLGGVLHD